MFHPALSWFGRSLIAVVLGLSWIGMTTSNLAAEDKPAAAHAEPEKAHAAPAADHPAPAGAHAASAADPHAAGHDPHAKPPGPIDWSTDLALWSLIVFVLFVAILKVFAWGPLSSALDQE